ncbi:MAG: ankyrin repeat domain-containing protein [Candidatus Dependentiae bacterium]|nr:ankyrin repeat domain-containing protein [Candidatus Dependentiae bacterium]
MIYRNVSPLLFLLLLCGESVLVFAGNTKSKSQIKQMKPKKKELNDLLAKAAEQGDLAALKDAIEHHADINTKVKFYDLCENWTPLMLATLGGHSACVKHLLEKKADIGLQSCHVSALTLAARVGDAECLTLLLTKSHSPAELNNSLSAAVCAGQSESTKILLGAHADINGRAKDGETIFSNTIKSGKIPVVKLLLEAGVDIPYSVFLSCTMHDDSFSDEDQQSFKKLLCDLKGEVAGHANISTDQVTYQQLKSYQKIKNGLFLRQFEKQKSEEEKID